MSNISANGTWNCSVDFKTDEELAALKIFQDYPDGLLTFASVCCVLFMVVGIPGNLVTIVALARCKKVRNATAIFIINLSFCDLLYCCFNLPLAASTFWMRSWPHGIVTCKLFPLARFALAAVALFTVVAITTNRYIMISHPRLYNKLYTDRHLALMVISIWLFSFGSLIATWLEKWGRFGMDPVTGLCSVLPDDNNKSPAKLLFICAFTIPYLVIIVCYGRIFYVVRKTTKKSRASIRKRRPVPEDSSFGTTTADQSPATTNNEANDSSEHRIQSIRETPSVRFSSTTFNDRPIDVEPPNSILRGKSIRTTLLLRRSRVLDKTLPSSKDRKLLTMITAIMLSFLICHLPLTVIKVYNELEPHPVPFILSTILRYMTTCINPIIYVVMSRDYRKAYKKVMHLPTCRDTFCRHWR